ncbi:hypothetical protein [Desulfitobacterium sp. PCE1]|uniref:hypothetical protein n=1 Tax=Desulfitobacterium sp. PCE1 TaxID=146907 RepID=UPI000380132F|nr:hypothetical protein [Desulfitobacterium sp. PCE1]
MSKNINFLFSLLIGLITVSVTLILFFLGHGDKSTLDWASLVFILIAELALFLGIIIFTLQPSSSGQTIMRTGIISVLFMYWLFTLVIGLFRNVFIDYTNIFYMINSAVIGLVAITSALIYRVSLSTKD